MISLAGRFKRALVTGGAGFIGSHLVEGLLQDGLEVVSVDDYSGGKRENLDELRNYRGLTEAECDITDVEKLRPLFEGVDIVFHQAASKMTVCLRDPRRDLEVNAKGAFNLLELARDHGVRKFVHASTGSVYGEAQYYPTDEQHPLNPTSYYGVSKLAGEKYARAFAHLYGIDATILRYYHVYGPRQENSDVGGVVSIFARRAMEGKPLVIFGDGTQMRSFTYVKDVVNINKLVALKPETKGQAYNCASGIKVTIQELAEKILDILDKSEVGIEYRDWKLGDIKKFDVSNEKLRKLGMDWKTPFDAGLKETLDWTKRWLQKRGVGVAAPSATASQS
jgi:UDP-glucose 4-epimerase